MTEIVFWLCILALLHTYTIYPLLLRILAIGRRENNVTYEEDDEFPGVSIIIPAHNEEAVIAAKLESIFENDYPSDKLEILIGSDASTDRTNEIVEGDVQNHPGVKLHVFDNRTGKPGIVNALVKESRFELLILTDANVMFSRITVRQLIKHFKNEEIVLVDSNMINRKYSRAGISQQEGTYIQMEVLLKNLEGRLWGKMMGPFGGCYALRKSCFTPIPENFVVDDFFIAMKAMEMGGKSINELKAECYEDVSNDLSEEFRRKVRISAGNFQNLGTFAHLLLDPFKPLSFAFFSHKVLRWQGPFLIIMVYLLNIKLLDLNFAYQILFIIQNGMIAFVLLDLLMKKIGIHSVILRFITHFYAMNLALLLGFIKYLKGVKSNVWEPTQRV